jgi:hypothetical protein
MMIAPNTIKEHTLWATFTEEDTLMNVGNVTSIFLDDYVRELRKENIGNKS